MKMYDEHGLISRKFDLYLKRLHHSTMNPSYLVNVNLISRHMRIFLTQLTNDRANEPACIIRI